MAEICCERVLEHSELELVTPFDKRELKVAFHDIDGTFSLIREWEPVMSATLSYVIQNGMPKSIDVAVEYVCGHISELGTDEVDQFCCESAGLSALTQMEWALRRSLQEGTLSDAPVCGDTAALESNDEIIRRIWAGDEEYERLEVSPERQEYMTKRTPDLFRLYEQVLYKACRDRNLAAARVDPEPFLVNGGIQFLEHLRNRGITNYFVTGSVVEHDQQGHPHGGIFEEVTSLGIPIGPGALVEDICGSTYDEKKPKPQVMTDLAVKLSVSGEHVLVVGDGRSEIAAGKKLGAICISRLNKQSVRQRQIHQELGTNVIVDDYDKEALLAMIR